MRKTFIAMAAVAALGVSSTAMAAMHGGGGQGGGRVGGIVRTKMRHRRTENGREPNGGDPEFHEIVEASRTPAQTTDAIAVADLHRLRRDPIDRRRVPPFTLIRRHLLHVQ